MRVVTISDTHSLQDGLDLPEADVLIHAGDLMNSGKYLDEIVSYASWLQTQSHKFSYIIQIAGNHDRLFEKVAKLSQDTLREIVGDKLIYLENESIMINGFKFWGSPYTPEFCSWAFQLYTAEEAKKIWDLIPPDVNVLITHGPVYGIFDFTEYDQEHVGCKELKTRIRCLPQLKCHIGGHIHEGYGVVKKKGVAYINASICDLRYNPVNAPIVFEMDVKGNVKLV